MNTDVVIVGAGPSGLLLALRLQAAGIQTVVLERQSPEYVLGRIRAGLLEQVAVDLLDELGVSERLHKEAIPDTGINFADGENLVRIDFEALTGKKMYFYGQTEIQKDLIEAAEARNLNVVWSAKDVALHDIDSDHPSVTYRKDGQDHRVEAKFIAGCDGFHGVSRASIPGHEACEMERAYPFGWLGILADVPPCNFENIYINHENGFALTTLRSHTRSRYYIQVPLTDTVEDWPDEKFWDEIELRAGKLPSRPIVRGPSIEKSIAPLRSFVCTRMRHGRLLLAGDSAHIVPPTGAKGLNLAVADVTYLSDALIRFFKSDSDDLLLGYEKKALDRIWGAQRFSWQLTNLLHKFPDDTAFERRMQITEMENIRRSVAMQTNIAENYVGTPL